jgi:hypothetical protein
MMGVFCGRTLSSGNVHALAIRSSKAPTNFVLLMVNARKTSEAGVCWQGKEICNLCDRTATLRYNSRGPKS